MSNLGDPRPARNSDSARGNFTARRLELLNRYFFAGRVGIGLPGAAGKLHPVPADAADLDALLRSHLTGEVVTAQLRGSQTGKVRRAAQRVSAYPFDDTGLVRWGCVDIDAHGKPGNPRDPEEAARRCVAALDAHGSPSHLERSAGGGWHVWVLLAELVPASQVRALLGALVPRDIPRADGAGAADLEIFPKSDGRAADGWGAGVWLPWWHAAAGANNQFHRLRADGSFEAYEPDDFTTLTAARLAELVGLLVPARVADGRRRGSTRAERLDGLARDTDGAAWAAFFAAVAARVDDPSVLGFAAAATKAHGWIVRDPRSTTGDRDPSAVIFRDSLAFHSSRDGLTLNVLDAMILAGRVASRGEGVRLLAELTGVRPPERVDIIRAEQAARPVPTLPTLADARDEIPSLLTDWCLAGNATNRAIPMLAHPPGVGKSAATHVLLECAAEEGKCGVLAVPTHKLAYEVAQRLAARGVNVVRRRGPLYVLGNEEEHYTRGAAARLVCAFPAIVRAAEAEGLNARKTVCKACPATDDCTARAEGAAVKLAAGVVNVVTHEFLPVLAAQLERKQAAAGERASGALLPADILLAVDEHIDEIREVEYVETAGVLGRLHVAETTRPYLDALGLALGRVRTLAPGERLTFREIYAPACATSKLNFETAAHALSELGALRWIDAHGAEVAAQIVAAERQRAEDGDCYTAGDAGEDVAAELPPTANARAREVLELLAAAAAYPDRPCVFRAPVRPGKGARGGEWYVTTINPLLPTLGRLRGNGLPVVLLDGTARESRLAACGVEAVTLGAREVAEVGRVRRGFRLATNAVASRALEDDGRGGRRARADALRGITAAAACDLRNSPPGGVLVVSIKALAGDLGEKPAAWVSDDYRDEIARRETRTAHFGGLRGLNQFEGARVALLIVDPRRNVASTERKAAVLGLDPRDVDREDVEDELTQTEGRLRAACTEGDFAVYVYGTVVPAGAHWSTAEVSTLAEARRSAAWTGRELREYRVAVGWSGAELARRAGVSQATVSRAEAASTRGLTAELWRALDANGIISPMHNYIREEREVSSPVTVHRSQPVEITETPTDEAPAPAKTSRLTPRAGPRPSLAPDPWPVVDGASTPPVLAGVLCDEWTAAQLAGWLRTMPSWGGLPVGRAEYLAAPLDLVAARWPDASLSLFDVLARGGEAADVDSLAAVYGA